jgi:hypothetical protein
MSREEQDLLRRKLQQRERSIAQGTAAHQIEASNIGVIEQVAVANRAILRDKTAAAAAARREREAQVRAALAAGEGSLIQRAQARLALATGGSGGGFGGVGGGGPRLPGEYPGLAGFFGRGALGGLQYGLPSLLLYRGVPAIADSVREAEELNIQLGLIERQLTSIGQEDSFDDLRDTILEVAANTGLASDELANTALLFAGAFGPEAAAGLRDIGAELEAAGELALVAGVSFDELEDSVIGVTRAFSEGADITTVRELGDIAVYLREQFGVAVTDITGFLGDIAPVAQAAGFSLEQIGLLGAQSLQLSGKGTAALAEAWGRVLPALNENRVAILQLVDGTRLYDSTLEAVQLGDYSNVLKNLIALYGDADEAQRAQIVSLIGERREAQAILPVFEQGTRVLANWDSELEVNGKLSDLAADVTERLTTRWAALTEQFNQLMRQVLEGGLAEGLEALLSIFQLLVSVLTDVASVLADVNDSLGGWPAKIAVAVAAFRGLTAVLRAASAAMTRYAAASATAQGGAVAGGIGGAAAGAAGGGLLAGAGRFGAAATGALGGPLGIALAIGGTVAFQLRDVGKQANEAVQAALRESVEEEAERTREELDSVVSELRDDASKGSLAQQIRTQDFSSLWNSIIGSDPTGILGGILGSFGAGQEPTGLEEYRAFREEQGNRIYQDLLSQYEDLLTLEGDAQNTAILAVQSTMRDIVTEDQERFDQFVIGLIELWFEGELESSEINALLFLFDFDDDTRGRLDAKIQDQLGLEQSTIDAVFRGIEGAQRNRGTDVNVEAWQSALTKLDEDAAAVIEEYGYQRVASDRNLQEAIFGADAARENVLGGALAETQQRIDELRYDIDVGQGREIDLIPLLEQEIADLERLVKPGAGGGAVLEGADALKARRDIAERFAEIQEIQDSVLLADIQNELEIAELRGAESPLVDAETALSILEGALQSEDLSPTARAELTPQIIDAIQKLTEERAEEAFEAQNYDEYLQIAQDGIDVADRFLIIFDAISQTTQAYARPENAAELRSLVAQVVGGQADISLSIILQILDQMYEAQLIALSEYNAFKRSVGRAAAREAGIPEGIIGAEERAGTDWTGIVEDVGESRQRVLDSIAPDITESEAASRVAAEQAKAAADAQRAADEANRVARANLEAEYALAIARANAQDDDVRVAELELDYARELLALLRQQGASYAEITKQEAAVIDAEAALRRAREENGEDRRAALEAEYAYRIAQAESLGDRSEAARLELELQQRILRLMESEGASDVDLQQQRTSILQAQTAAQEAVLQARLEELQFLYDMGELDNTAYIAELEALLASGTLRVDQVRDIRRKLQALRNDVSRDLRVNLPDFALPTLYEARRAVAEADIGAFAPGRGGYQDQRVTTINLYASNAVDGEAAVMFIANSVGGPTRIGGRIGRY